MKLNHTNLTVADVEATADFLQEYFELEKRGGSPAITILSDETGTVLTLMQGREGEEIEYPSSFHIGFFVERRVVGGRETPTVEGGRLRRDGRENPPQHLRFLRRGSGRVFHRVWGEIGTSESNRTSQSVLIVSKMCARNTNIQPHSLAACRVGWQTLVPGGR